MYGYEKNAGLEGGGKMLRGMKAKKCEERQREKLEKIYSLYKNKMFGRAMQILNQREDAEDAVQNCIIAISRHTECIDLYDEARTLSFVYTVISHCAIDIYRKNKKSRQSNLNIDDVAEQAGQTSVLESVCKEAKTRYDINQSNNNLNAIIGGETSLSDEKTQLKDYYNSRNTAVYVNTKNYDKSGYLYSMYLLNDEEVKKLTDKEVELKKADDTEKLTPFLENAPDDSKYSAGNIYFIGGRKSRKFIVYKNKSDDMYIGKCVGFESLKDHDIITDKKVNEKKSISAGEFLENIMDIKNADDIREIMLERVRAKSKANPDKRIAVWTSDESKSELYEFLTKESSIEMESVGDTSGQLWFGAAEPQKCYYLAVENNAGEFCVFGIVFEEKDTMVYVEPQYKPGTALKLSYENTAKLRKIIKENDKQQ